MAPPKHWDLMHPILEVCKDGKVHHRGELLKIVADQLNLSREDRTELQAVGKQTVFENRLGWATFHLKKAGFVNQNRGNVSITDEGARVLKENYRVDKKFLLTIPKYQEEYVNKIKEYNKQRRQSPITEMDDISEYSPEDRIEADYKEVSRKVKEELLEKIKKNTPGFFEKLVVELIRELGYGTDHEITGKPGDGGIDGIIKDELGLDEIYLQAKKWGGPVPSHEVKSFAGSISAKSSKKGILITSSDFTKDGYDFVEKSNVKIALINGEKLVNYMYDKDLGIKKVKTYEIKEIDEDYFQD